MASLSPGRVISLASFFTGPSTGLGSNSTPSAPVEGPPNADRHAARREQPREISCPQKRRCGVRLQGDWPVRCQQLISTTEGWTWSTTAGNASSSTCALLGAAGRSSASPGSRPAPPPDQKREGTSPRSTSCRCHRWASWSRRPVLGIATDGASRRRRADRPGMAERAPRVPRQVEAGDVRAGRSASVRSTSSPRRAGPARSRTGPGHAGMMSGWDGCRRGPRRARRAGRSTHQAVSPVSRSMRYVIQIVPQGAGHPWYRAYSGFPTAQPGASRAKRGGEIRETRPGNARSRPTAAALRSDRA